MVDYRLFTNEDEEIPGEGVLLKKARARSKGGMVTDTVTPGQASVLPNAIAQYRGRAADLYGRGERLYNSEPDLAQLQAFAKQRGEQGDRSMLTALAAQFAGESFAPVQEQMLKKAAAARDPMKLGGGMLMADGQFIKDPFAERDKRAEFLLQQAKAYETLAQTAQSGQECLAAQQAQNEITNQLRLMGLGIQQMNAQTARAATGPGGKAPSGYQWTTGPDGAPALSFIPGGPGDPAVKSAGTPSEDERKAASWFFQADNARRNMERVVARNPKAAYPTITERGAGLVPLVGEDLANTLRPEDRQMFVQAAGSMAEALLRAATGAGVNESEARQKIAELVPQLGDKPGNVKQKTEAYEVYMKSLQARAGRALPAGAGTAPGADNDPFGIRGRKP